MSILHWSIVDLPSRCQWMASFDNWFLIQHHHRLLFPIFDTRKPPKPFELGSFDHLMYSAAEGLNQSRCRRSKNPTAIEVSFSRSALPRMNLLLTLCSPTHEPSSWDHAWRVRPGQMIFILSISSNECNRCPISRSRRPDVSHGALRGGPPSSSITTTSGATRSSHWELEVTENRYNWGSAVKT